MSNEHKTRAERIEILAAIEHDQWMSWAKSLMENESLSTMRIDRWSSLMVPYSDLPEEMREHDRKWARLALDALPPDPPRGDGWEALRELREWAESRIAGREYPYVGPSAPESDDIWGAVVLMADRMLAAAPKPKPTKSPAEPAQDDEDAISSVSAKTFDVASENETALWVCRIWHELARRLAHEKADLRAKLAASDEILAEVRVEADGLMRALRRIAKLGKGGA